MSLLRHFAYTTCSQPWLIFSMSNKATKYPEPFGGLIGDPTYDVLAC